jgi:leucyl-tRNA synthetase
MTLVQMLAPMAPFVAEELWRTALGVEGSVHQSAWPSFDAVLAREETVTLVVQVDGRVRDRLEVPVDVTGEEAERLARESEGARRVIGDRQVARVIVRPPKLVNLVTS